MKKEIIILNKEDSIIKSYLEARENLINLYIQSGGEKDFLPLSSIDSVDGILRYYDRKLTEKKLSKKAYQYIHGYSEIVMLVEHEWVFFVYDSYSPKLESFRTEKELKNFCKEYDEEYDENDFRIVKLNQINGNFEDNLSLIDKKNENGFYIFIKSDSLYSDNIIIGFIN